MAKSESLAIRVSPKAKVRLSDFDPADTHGIKRDEAERRSRSGQQSLSKCRRRSTARPSKVC